MTTAAIVIALASIALNVWTIRNMRRTDRTQLRIAQNQLRIAEIQRDHLAGSER